MGESLTIDTGTQVPGHADYCAVSTSRNTCDCGGTQVPVTGQEPSEVDRLANLIRQVDGNHSLGAGALAEALMRLGVTLDSLPPMHTVDLDGNVRKLDGPDVWDPPPGGAHTKTTVWCSDSEVEGGIFVDVCAKCDEEEWPCEASQRYTVYYEDDSDRPDDAVPLYRLLPVEDDVAVPPPVCPDHSATLQCPKCMPKVTVTNAVPVQDAQGAA